MARFYEPQCSLTSRACVLTNSDNKQKR